MQNQNYNSAVSPDNEIGRKTFFWYRVYLAVMTVLYLLVAAFGIFLLVAQPESATRDAMEIYITGIVYTAFGIVLFIIFGVALFLPRRPYNWIVGIILTALGMTSCCFLPFLVPLFIYWLKPETKAYFGRN